MTCLVFTLTPDTRVCPANSHVVTMDIKIALETSHSQKCGATICNGVVMESPDFFCQSGAKNFVQLIHFGRGKFENDCTALKEELRDRPKSDPGTFDQAVTLAAPANSLDQHLKSEFPGTSMANCGNPACMALSDHTQRYLNKG